MLPDKAPTTGLFSTLIVIPNQTDLSWEVGETGAVVSQIECITPPIFSKTCCFVKTKHE